MSRAMFVRPLALALLVAGYSCLPAQQSAPAGGGIPSIRYQRHWIRLVSPGEPIYAFGASGEKLILQARRQSQLPSGKIHEKDVFI